MGTAGTTSEINPASTSKPSTANTSPKAANAGKGFFNNDNNEEIKNIAGTNNTNSCSNISTKKKNIVKKKKNLNGKKSNTGINEKKGSKKNINNTNSKNNDSSKANININNISKNKANEEQKQDAEGEDDDNRNNICIFSIFIQNIIYLFYFKYINN